jgi:hypothetical protein
MHAIALSRTQAQGAALSFTIVRFAALTAKLSDNGRKDRARGYAAPTRFGPLASDSEKQADAVNSRRRLRFRDVVNSVDAYGSRDHV